MSSLNFVNPKNRDWVAPTLKELERGPKITPEPESPKPTTPQKLIILERDTNYSNSMKILKDNNLRPLTYQEALSHSAELIEKLKGKCFWLSGNGKDLKETKGVYAFDNQGNLMQLIGNETLNQKVHFWSGDKPLLLEVLTDGLVRYRKRCFDLHANAVPEDFALAVVGVRA